MRLPTFTAEAVFSSPPMTTPGVTESPHDPRVGEVRPAFYTSCLRTCIESGADGCGPFCACIARGGKNCPVLY
jgi:hypothetical protein